MMFCKCYGLDLCILMLYMHAAQIKEAILNGVSLEDDKRDQFNKIAQVCWLISHFEINCCIK